MKGEVFILTISDELFQVWVDVYTLPVPGSGGKTCAQIFEEAGCDTPGSPGCGACLGGPRDTYARMNEAQVTYSTPYSSVCCALQV